jgi:small multidrug resistance pump
MPYLIMLGAIAFEVVGTSLLKATDGFTRLWPTVACLGSYVAAFVLLAWAIKQQMPVGVAYAMWSGLGTAAIVAIGVLFLNEAISFQKIAGVLLVIGGVVVLNLGGAH